MAYNNIILLLLLSGLHVHITLQDRIYTWEGNCEWILHCARMASSPVSTE